MRSINAFGATAVNSLANDWGPGFRIAPVQRRASGYSFAQVQGWSTLTALFKLFNDRPQSIRHFVAATRIVDAHNASHFRNPARS
jgi:hypothetical protein